MNRLSIGLLAATALALTARADDAPKASAVGVVCGVQVLSDKVPDVSSLDAWKRSFLKDGMTDREKALAAWRTAVAFQHQDDPPNEYLHSEAVVMDPIKVFNVYGYGFCSMTSADVAALARHAGLKARGWGINAHSVPEVYFDGAWHLLDASLVNYFPKADGSLAGVEEIVAAVKEWHEKNPGLQGRRREAAEVPAGRRLAGWKRGPDLLARCPLYDAQRLVAGQDARVVLHHAGVRRHPGQERQAVPVRVRVLAGLPGERPPAAGRAADPQLVEQGPARQHARTAAAPGA